MPRIFLFFFKKQIAFNFYRKFIAKFNKVQSLHLKLTLATIIIGSTGQLTSVSLGFNRIDLCFALIRGCPASVVRRLL